MIIILFINFIIFTIYNFFFSSFSYHFLIGKSKSDADPFHILRKILDKKTLPAVKVSLVKCDNSKMKVLNNSSSSQGPPIAITNSANGSQCPYCRRIYADADAVTRHIKKYCLKEKRFGCIFCQYRSKRKDHIVRHTIRVHDAQLRDKIRDGVISVPSDAVLKDFKMDEAEAALNDNMNNSGDDVSLMDFSALYPEISDATERDEEIPVKTELLESEDDDF